MKGAMKALLAANPEKDYCDDELVFAAVLKVCGGFSKEKFKQLSDVYWQAAMSTGDPDIAIDMDSVTAGERPVPHEGMRFDSYKDFQSFIKQFNQYSGNKFIVVASKHMEEGANSGYAVLRCNQYKAYIEPGVDSGTSSETKRVQTKSKAPCCGCAARINVIKEAVGGKTMVKISMLYLEHTGHNVIAPETVTVVDTNKSVLRGLACEIALAGLQTSAALKVVSLTHNFSASDKKQIHNFVYREHQRLGVVETADKLDALMKQMEKDGYKVNISLDASQQINVLFWMSDEQQRLAKSKIMDVLAIDCTYNILRCKLPVFHVIGKNQHGKL
ncbi:hypothetical protein GGI22_003034, partial [Coemansia erecta]